VVFNEVGNGAHARRDLVTQHVGHHGGAATVGRRHQIEAVLLGQHLHQELRHRGWCGNAHCTFATVVLHPGHVVFVGLGWGSARDGQRVDEGGEARHRHKVLGRIEARGLHHLGQDGNAVVVRQKQRVPVGWRSLEGLCGNLPTGACLVVHHHSGAQGIFQRLGQQACDGVGAAACREAHH